MQFNKDKFSTMLKQDAVVAGYGVVAGVWRKGISKLLGARGIGDVGINLVTLAAGTAMSQAENVHVTNLGGALRIGSLVRMGTSLVESVTGSRKNKEETK